MTLPSFPLPVQRRAWQTATATPIKAALLPDRLRRMATAEPEETPYDVVYTENNVKLRHYRSPADETHDVPVVYTFPLFNDPSLVDLRPELSVIRRFLEAGFDVYLIEWSEPSWLDASLEFRDYVIRYMDNCADVVRDRTGADGVHLFGYSASVPPVVMYGALSPENVATMGLKAPPIDFDVESEAFDFRAAAEPTTRNGSSTFSGTSRPRCSTWDSRRGNRSSTP